MIERIQAYRATDGTTHETLEQVQQHELEALLIFEGTPTAKDIADSVFLQKDKIVDILTTSPTSKAKARKINGGTKKRNMAKVEAVEEKA